MSVRPGTELAQAARRLVGARTFSVVAVLTLALGAGALGTIYSVAKALFLNRLPYPGAERIVVLNGEMRREDVQAWPAGVHDLRDVGAAQQAMLGPVPVAGGRGFSVRVGEAVEHVAGELVGAEYLNVFGLVPALGRFFTGQEEEQRVVAGVVLSHDLWVRHFGGAPDVIGRTLQVNERSAEVIGIAPAGFHGLYDDADLWLPIGSAAALYQPGYLDVREFRWLAGVARLRDGVAASAAAEQVEAALRRLEAEFPKEYAGFHLTLQPLARFLFGDLREPVWMLLGAAALVLAIACTNLASLLLVRGLGRRRELALRRALGATGAHVTAPVVAELVLLAAAGAALGLLAAELAIRPLVAATGVDLPRFVVPRVDMGVAGLTLAVCLGTSLLFALVPVGYASAVDPMAALRETGHASTGGRGRRRLQNALVVLETALCIVLLVGTGLLVRGLGSLLATDLGFTTEQVTAMRLNMGSTRYTENERYVALARDLLDRAADAPGVTAAALEGPGYPTYGAYGLHFWNDNAPGGPEDLMTHRHHVSPGYFSMLGITLEAGRDFTAADQGEAGHVVVVSREVARRVWPGQDPVGRTLRTSRGTEMTLTVIGVVDDVRHQGLSATTFSAPQVYLPLMAFPPKSPPSLTLLVKSAAPPGALATTLKSTLHAADPELPVVEIRSLPEAVREQTASNRLLARLMAAFALLALLLAAVGVYGVVSYSVERTVRELGIRRAIGAGTGRILRHVLLRGLAPVGVGVCAGLLGVPIVQRLVSSQLHGVGTYDPLALGGALLTLLAIATAATLVPAMRAARISPLAALKGD